MVSESGKKWFMSLKQWLPDTATFYMLKELPFVLVLDSPVVFQGENPFPSEIPFGLEVGAGSMPTKVYNLDQRIPWILTECDLHPFTNLVADIPKCWKDSPLDDLPEPVIIMHAYATPELQLQAHFLIYKNPKVKRNSKSVSEGL